MGKYLKKFENHQAYENFVAGGTMMKPNVSLCKQLNEIHYNPYIDYSNEYLTFVALEDGTFQLSTNAVSYSLDNGETWTELAAATATPTVTAGNKIMWKGTMTPTSYQGIGKFGSTGNFDVQGNIMSLLYGDDYKGKTSLIEKDFAFYYLFSNNTKLTNAENLSLPATTLANHCYNSMFSGCTGLISTPELLATTLASSCYNGMFWGCTSLTTATELPATTLANDCYANMFNSCTNLNYIKAMFTTTPSNSYTYSWVSGVASTGTFIKNSAATWTTTGNNGVPNGWTVQTASE